MKITVGSDHAGFKSKQGVVKYLRALGHRVEDLGTVDDNSVDYPDFAKAVADTVRRKKADRGVLVCGTGIGMAIAANKVKGVRAAPVWSRETARLAAEHNGANVLCLSGRLFKPAQLKDMLSAWLTTPFGGGRHLRRLRKIHAIENREK